MAFYRERDLRQFAREVTGDGIGIGGGFVVGGALGALAESKLAPYDPFTADRTLFQKLWGWASNNGAKAVLYILAKKYDATHPVARKATEALAGSVVYDTILRLANNGNPNPNPISIGGYRILGQGQVDVNRLVNENNVLRTELNKALQRLAGTDAMLPSNASNYASPRQEYYASMPEKTQFGSYPEASMSPEAMKFVHDRGAGFTPENRQRAFAQMPFVQTKPGTGIQPRQTRYGAMPVNDMPIANIKPYVARRQTTYGSMSTEERRHLFGMNISQGGS